MEITEALKALSDENRLRIMNLLHDNTLCACDLEEVLEINQSNLSRHLSKLKQSGLISAKKKALFTYYSRQPLPEPYGPILEQLCATASIDSIWQKDRERLAAFLSDPDRPC